jgi:hypothetical protein
MEILRQDLPDGQDFSSLPGWQAATSAAAGGAASFVPAPGRDKKVRSILLILSDKSGFRFYFRIKPEV